MTNQQRSTKVTIDLKSTFSMLEVQEWTEEPVMWAESSLLMVGS